MTTFHNQYQDRIEDFDRMIVNLLLQKDHTGDILINRLKKIISEVIKIYDQNNELLNNLDIDSICQKVAKRYDTIIQEQSHRTGECRTGLTKIEGTLDILPYRGLSKEEKQFLFRKRDSVIALCDEEKKKISSLYELQIEAWEAAGRKNKNRVKNIHNLNLSLLAGIENYFTDRNPTAIAGNNVPIFWNYEWSS